MDALFLWNCDCRAYFVDWRLGGEAPRFQSGACWHLLYCIESSGRLFLCSCLVASSYSFLSFNCVAWPGLNLALSVSFRVCERCVNYSVLLVTDASGVFAAE